MATDWARLRQIMYQPSATWLSTVYGYGTERWLTDWYVLYNVTGFEWEWPDGPCQIAVSGLKERDSVPEQDVGAWLDQVYSAANWVHAEPTEWSVAEHPCKAMLWISGGLPCLLGEPTWVALRRNHPGCIVDYAHGCRSLFRFSEVRHVDLDADCLAGTCECRPVPFCFAAGIRCPEGQEGIACEVASLKAV